jgi:hypothetical protein
LVGLRSVDPNRNQLRLRGASSISFACAARISIAAKFRLRSAGHQR